MLIALTVVGIFVCLGYWQLVRFEERGRLTAPFILAAMPLATVLPATAVPLTALQAIFAFQSVARAGQGNAQTAVILANGITQPLALACAGFVLALLVAGGLHVLHAGTPTPLAEFDEHAPAPAGRPSGHIVLFLAAAVGLPVLGLVRFVASVAPVIAHAGRVLTVRNPPPAVDGIPVQRLSAILSGRLIVGSLGGGGLLLLVIAGSLVGVIMARSSGRSAAIERAAWVMFALMLGAGIWSAAALAHQWLAFQAPVIP